MSAVTLEPKKRKSVTVSTYSPSICLEVMRLEQCFVVVVVVFSTVELFGLPKNME